MGPLASSRLGLDADDRTHEKAHKTAEKLEAKLEKLQHGESLK
jgi:hypothetical protein